MLGANKTPDMESVAGRKERACAREIREIHNALLELALQMRGRKMNARAQRAVGQALNALLRARYDVENDAERAETDSGK